MDTIEGYAPTGARIVGTAEMTPGTATITFDGAAVNAGDRGAYDHTGGTNVDWDGQETLTLRGETLFVDDEGEQWPASQVRLGGDDTPYPEAAISAMRRRNSVALALDRAVQLMAEAPFNPPIPSGLELVRVLEALLSGEDAAVAQHMRLEHAAAMKKIEDDMYAGLGTKP